MHSAGLEAKCKAEVSSLPEPPPPPPATLACAPRTLEAFLGQSVTLHASGGAGSYVWSAPQGTPSSGAGPVFTTSFTVVGGHEVTLTSGNEWARCKIEVGRDKTTEP